MRRAPALLLVISLSLVLWGCSTQQTTEPDPLATAQPEVSISPEMQDRILSMNPEQVSGQEVEELLSIGPAPRVINIHGGIYPVHIVMESFAEFLMGMGYPEESIRNPGDGSTTFSCYDDSKKIAGAIAWYYEHEGMRPLMVGHSQGGIQAVKVLHVLAGNFGSEIAVWNPLTGKKEQRYEIREPLTGEPTPVVGLKVSYATAVGAGGLTRILPNQWKMMRKLRRVPDSVVEFTGFYASGDLLGGDMLGFGSSNHYEPDGTARVRNVLLPSGNNHFNTPSTRHLLESREITDWLNNYEQTNRPTLDVEFDSDSSHVLWAGDVWHSIKKHWVLELQRLINAQQEQVYAY
jgi:hypothetical protein